MKKLRAEEQTDYYIIAGKKPRAVQLYFLFPFSSTFFCCSNLIRISIQTDPEMIIKALR